MEIIGGLIESLDRLHFERNDFLEISMGSHAIYLKGIEKTISYHDYNYDQKTETHALLIGRIYDEEIIEYNKPAYSLYNIYRDSGIKGLAKVDGDFLFILYESNSDRFILVADKEGTYPIYYSCTNGLLISSNIEILVQELDEEKVDISSIYDFLSYGTTLGDRTFSKEVKILNGGHWLTYQKKSIIIEKYYEFIYSEDMGSKKQLIEELGQSYINAIKKRIDRDYKSICIFTSGGMDSRLLVAAINQLSESRVDCFSFGQVGASEVNIAREVSELNSNKFTHLTLEPEDFIENSYQYILYTGGMDMFPQSYIINIAKRLREEKNMFFNGFAIDALIGGTFINQKAIDSKDKFSDFVLDNKGVLKMNVFSEAELKQLCKKNVFEDFFSSNSNNLRIEAEKEDSHRVKDIIQPFGVKNRAKRVVMLRDTVPKRFLDVYYPSLDVDFLKAVSKIPASYRKNHEFYRAFFIEFAPEYSKIIYNNTNLPITAPIEYWKEGSEIEYNREKLYEKIMCATGNSRGEYYKHYYSDFNGYSRYNKLWRQYFDKYLLTDDAYIVKHYFDLDVIKQYYKEHIDSIKNHRQKLVYLLSLEMFFKVFVEKKNNF